MKNWKRYSLAVVVAALAVVLAVVLWQRDTPATQEPSPSPFTETTPSLTPTVAPSPVPTPADSPLPSEAVSPSPAAVPSPSAPPTATPSPFTETTPSLTPTVAPSPVPTPADSPLPSEAVSPSPAAVPSPSAPPTATPSPEAETGCTMTIRCDTVLENLDALDPDKAELVPDDGVLLGKMDIDFADGESAFDLLKRVCRDQSIHLEFSITPGYGSAYIEGIGNLYEFDCGERSGWLYRVNGQIPDVACSSYTLQAGDVVEFLYSCDWGQDLG